ncbi:HNH endonuclease [Marinobacter sp. ATCH36]|uniref:HNH endonuclease n=1 Tax=Marinobacter sp. ATCH36 TaxID=2945106 RepID=UPI002021C153|nr:HNH endonuclease [Marinobacter sp. ATCH36]MCL7943442.1 HNH endonuclease [Marinobacter sp. ATCH36]
MWQNNIGQYARKHGISLARARFFQCTGEHLVAHSEGGSASDKNIVAACLFCNQGRHKRKNPPGPSEYVNLVQKRLERGAWNSHLL